MSYAHASSTGSSSRVSERLVFAYFFGALGGMRFGYSATLGQEPKVQLGVA
ncbi:MAG: hypothetical protein M3305_07390 [Actinomycetota bacterium]|nr:hypothetical protein [Actinomycetota bacterium]